MKRSGGAIIVQCLLEQGVDTVFGYPGVSIIRVYDELYKVRRQIRHVLTAHEQGAAHAADGYARATGRVGVCLATSGPGATNLITGIAAAFMDSSPVVFLTCNVAERLLGRDAFQEVDITGISMPITKCSYLVRSADQLADTLREAFALAAGGRPGPVLVDVTYNATEELADYDFLPREKHLTESRAARMLRRGESFLRRPEIDRADVETLADMLRAAKRPLLLAGGGVIRAGGGEALRQLALGRSLPVAATMMGLGALPADAPVFLGMAGMYGTAAANEAIDQCDLLAAFGVRFSDRVTGPAERFARNARLVHVDIDRAEIDKNVETAHHIVGDAREVLRLLDGALGSYRAPDWLPPRPAPAPWSGPAALVAAIDRLTGGEALVVTDVGQHQLWAAKGYGFRHPGQLITSGGYGAMGFGLGAALGAKAGCPEKTVVHITGDGSFRMNCPELATEVRYGLPVITVVFNNGALGLVRQKQTRDFRRRYSQTDLNGGPDLTKLAEAYGLPAFRTETQADFEAAFSRLLALGGGVLDCAIGKDETV